MKNKIKFAMVMSMFASQLTWAQTEHGNGGDVIVRDNHSYLVDFAEWGNEMHPSIASDIRVPEQIVKRIDVSFPKATSIKKLERFKFQLGKKLTEISVWSPTFSEVVLSAMEYFAWSFVNYDIVPIKDAHLKIVGTPYQIANRSGAHVQINKRLFDQMDAENEVGLIFHELLYALSSDQLSSDGTRPLVGYLFSIDQHVQINAVLYRLLTAAHLGQSLAKTIMSPEILIPSGSAYGDENFYREYKVSHLEFGVDTGKNAESIPLDDCGKQCQVATLCTFFRGGYQPTDRLTYYYTISTDGPNGQHAYELKGTPQHLSFERSSQEAASMSNTNITEYDSSSPFRDLASCEAAVARLFTQSAKRLTRFQSFQYHVNP